MKNARFANAKRAFFRLSVFYDELLQMIEEFLGVVSVHRHFDRI